MKVRLAGCLKLICIAVVELWAPLSRFLEGAPYKLLNESINNRFQENRECIVEMKLRWSTVIRLVKETQCRK